MNISGWTQWQPGYKNGKVKLADELGVSDGTIGKIYYNLQNKT